MSYETAETSSSFQLAPQQAEALRLAQEWVDADDFDSKPIFRLFGWAGTGKTTTIRHTIEAMGLDLHADTRFAAYTGKAALVMRKQGLPASTIHSLIYKPTPPDRDKCKALHAELLAAETEAEKRRLRQALKDAEQFTYELREREDFDRMGIELIVLDECSMVDDDMMRDLLTFKIPLFVLGDPGQLPPVKGTGALIRDKPDVVLTEIHRQAEGNPIIDMATRIRNGIPLPYGAYGTSAKITKGELKNDLILSADQILVGKNDTRRKINKEVRSLKNLRGTYPQPGDKLICLRNNKALGLFNGLICEVVEVGELLDYAIELHVRPETYEPDDDPLKVEALLAHFDVYEDKGALDQVRPWMFSAADEFDFGYAITVHKAQGSQWENVILYDDKFLSWKPEERQKWLYTAVTRAAETITIAA